jgi:hypothetical protein
MKWFITISVGGLIQGVSRLRMAKRLLSGDTVRIVANKNLKIVLMIFKLSYKKGYH